MDGECGEPYGVEPDGLLRWMGRCGETAVCALPGEGHGTEALGGALWGKSGWVNPSDGALRGDCGVCPPGRVHGTEALGRALWGWPW